VTPDPPTFQTDVQTDRDDMRSQNRAMRNSASRGKNYDAHALTRYSKLVTT